MGLHAALRSELRFSGRRCPAKAAARFHRKSPEKPMCSHVSGEVWPGVRGKQADLGFGHARNPRPHRHTTVPEHMPSAHRRYADWTPTRLLREAAAIGPATIALVERILSAKPHPEQGFRACLGILRLDQMFA